MKRCDQTRVGHDRDLSLLASSCRDSPSTDRYLDFAKKPPPPAATPQSNALHRLGSVHEATSLIRKCRRRNQELPRQKEFEVQAGREERGQQAIDSTRAQKSRRPHPRALHEGEPPHVGSATQAAMQRYQADQGWQSKTTPDARALIKLGLAQHDHLLNPKAP